MSMTITKSSLSASYSICIELYNQNPYGFVLNIHIKQITVICLDDALVILFHTIFTLNAMLNNYKFQPDLVVGIVLNTKYTIRTLRFA